MTPEQRAQTHYKYLTDPTFNAEHHRMVDMVATTYEHWNIALEMSLFGRAFVWVNPLGRCHLLNQNDLDFGNPGNTCVYLRIPGGDPQEIPGDALIELVMTGDTPQKKISSGVIEIRKLTEFQQQQGRGL